MAADPFEDVLNLEDQFYQEGYNQGMEDGEQAGKIEGRAFGLEKGYEKFLQSGRLYGKSVVWANRLSTKQHAKLASDPAAAAAAQTLSGAETTERRETLRLPELPSGSKLEKNIASLQALVEPASLSTENTDESVNDFDDRLKRARGKAKVVERMLGEDIGKDAVGPETHHTGNAQPANSTVMAAAAPRTDW